MTEDNRAPFDHRKRRKLATTQARDRIPTELLNTASGAVSDSMSSKDPSLHSEVEVPITKLSAIIAWDWKNYVESSHDQFCEQCREWFTGWEDKLTAMTEHGDIRSSGGTTHHLSKKSFSDAVRSGCPFCLLIYDKHSRNNPWLKLDNMGEVTGLPFTTLSIEETAFLKKEKCVDIYVTSPGNSTLDRIYLHFTFWQGDSAFSGMCLIPGLSMLCVLLRSTTCRKQPTKVTTSRKLY